MGDGTARAGLVLLVAAAAVVSARRPCTCALVGAGEASCAPAGQAAETAWAPTPDLRRLRVAGCSLEAAAGLEGVARVDATGGGYVAAALLAEMRELRVLTMRRADVVDLAGRLPRRGLARLETLDLAGNRVVDLGGGVLAPLTNLTELDLAANRLPAARKAWFAGLRHLRALNLSRNLIADEKEGEAASFQPLTSLRRLGLAGNRLTKAPRGFLDGLAQLRVLDLSSNIISSLDDAVFESLGNLQSLDLCFNSLLRLARGAFLGLARLQRLTLASNSIEALQDDAFSALHSLLYLNLSDNALSSLGEGSFSGLSRLQTLDISRNGLPAVSPGTLQPLSGLTELLMAGNPLQPGLMVAGKRLTTVEAASAGLVLVPASLTRSVRVLRLAGNMISAVRCGDLDGYPLLHTLDLAGNRVADVEDDALGRLELLSTLLLQDNQLPGVPRSLPAGLLTLILQGNPITRVTAGDLQGIPRLRQLSLRRCLVEEVTAGAFAQLQSLQELDLSENPVKTLQGSSLAGPAGLKILRLSQMRELKEPPQTDEEMSFPLGSPEHLELLELDGSPLLARHLLLDTAALAAFRGLQELNLEFDGLEGLRSDLPHFLPRLKVLRLSGNPWECSAGLLWLADWLRRNPPPAHAAATCAQPRRLASTSVALLRDDDFEDGARYGTSANSDRTPTLIEYGSEGIPNYPAETSISTDIFAGTTQTDGDMILTYPHTTPESRAMPGLVSSTTTIPKDLSMLHSRTTTSTANQSFSQHLTFPQNVISTPSTTLHDISQSSKKHNHNNTRNVKTRINVNMATYSTKPLPANDRTHPRKTTKSVASSVYINSTGSKINLTNIWPNKTSSDMMKHSQIFNIPKEHSKQQTNLSSTAIYFISDSTEQTAGDRTVNTSSQNLLEKKLNLTQVAGNATHINSVPKNIHMLNEKLAMAMYNGSDKPEDLYFMQGDEPTENSRSPPKQQNSGGETNKIFTSTPLTTASHKTYQESDAIGPAVDTKTNFSKREYRRESTNSTNSTIQNTSTTLPLHAKLSMTENVTSLPERHNNLEFSSNGALSSGDNGGRDGTRSSPLATSSHPGMFVFVVVGALMAAALATALSHCAKRRRQTAVEYSRQQDIEVRSISSIGDIW